MPNGDKTGPNGKGPKTGRNMGKCDGALASNRGCCRRAGFFRRQFLEDKVEPK